MSPRDRPDLTHPAPDWTWGPGRAAGTGPAILDADLFDDAAGSDGDVPLLTRAISHDALSDAAAAWARRLATAHLVAVEMEPAADVIAALLGAWRAGVAAIVVPPGSFEPARHFLPRWQPDAYVRRGVHGRLVLERMPPPPGPRPHPDLRLLVPAPESGDGGATGDAWARIDATALRHRAEALAHLMGLTPSDRLLVPLPLDGYAGLAPALAALAAGGALVLTERSVIDATLWSQAARAGVTAVALAPAQVELLARDDYAGLAGLRPRLVAVGGDPADPAVAREWDAVAHRHGWTGLRLHDRPETGPLLIDGDRPGPGLALSLRGADGGAPVTAAGRPGDLVADGPGVMMGLAAGRDDLAAPREPGPLPTGDIALRDGDGALRLTGRAGRVVTLFGRRVALDEFESRLAAVGYAGYAVPVGDRLTLLVADADEPDEVRSAAASLLGADGAAIDVARLRAVPLTRDRRVDRAALRDMAVAALAARPRPGSLADALLRATRVAAVRDGDSFAGLGGSASGWAAWTGALAQALGRVPPDAAHLTLAEARLQQAARRAEAAEPEATGPVRLPAAMVLQVGLLVAVAVALALGQTATAAMSALLVLLGAAWGVGLSGPIGRGASGRVASLALWPWIGVLFVGVVLLAVTGYGAELAALEGGPDATARPVPALAWAAPLSLLVSVAAYAAILALMSAWALPRDDMRVAPWRFHVRLAWLGALAMGVAAALGWAGWLTGAGGAPGPAPTIALMAAGAALALATTAPQTRPTAAIVAVVVVLALGLMRRAGGADGLSDADALVALLAGVLALAAAVAVLWRPADLALPRPLARAVVRSARGTFLTLAVLPPLLAVLPTTPWRLALGIPVALGLPWLLATLQSRAAHRR